MSVILTPKPLRPRDVDTVAAAAAMNRYGSDEHYDTALGELLTGVGALARRARAEGA